MIQGNALVVRVFTSWFGFTVKVKVAVKWHCIWKKYDPVTPQTFGSNLNPSLPLSINEFLCRHALDINEHFALCQFFDQ